VTRGLLKETLGARLQAVYSTTDGPSHDGIKNGTGGVDSSISTSRRAISPYAPTVRLARTSTTTTPEPAHAATDPQGKLERFFQDPAGDRLQTNLEATTNGFAVGSSVRALWPSIAPDNSRGVTDIASRAHVMPISDSFNPGDGRSLPYG